MKKTSLHWKIFRHEYILSALLISAPLFCPAQTEQKLSMELQEAQVARTALERENAGLKQELVEKSKELDALRSLYADSIIEQSKMIERLRALELSAAHLIGGGGDEGLKELFSEAISSMALVRRQILAIEQEFAVFEQSLAAALDGLQPSDAMRREFENRVMSLRRVIESSLKPLSLVAGRGNGDPDKTGCRILSLDESTQSVLLDRGYQNDCRIGKTLVVKRDGEVLATLKVVESRADCSAAMLISGSWQVLLPGMALSEERGRIQSK